MSHSRVLIRSFIVITIAALVFMALYMIAPLLHQPLQVRAVGSMPLLQLPWPTGQQRDINGGDTYGCGGHIGLDYDAIDFNFSLDQPVSAVADGIAHVEVDSIDQNGGYGNYVWVAHVNNYISIYAHLDKFAINPLTGLPYTPKSSFAVKQGAIIGYAGKTGNAQGVHLHFALHSGVKLNNKYPEFTGNAAQPEPMSGYTGFGQYGIHGPINKNPKNCLPNNPGPNPPYLSQPPQPESGAILSVSTGITAPSSITLNQSFTTNYTVTNTSTVPFNLRSLYVIVRDQNNNDVVRIGDNNGTPIAPQATCSFSSTIPDIGNKCKTCRTGTYTVSAAVLLPNGTMWDNLPATIGAQSSVEVNVTLPAFTIVPSPNTSNGCNNYLVATSASSQNDVWAVGNEDCGNPVMLIEHWNGTQWSIFSNPPVPVQSGSELFAVSAQSATNVWVVGYVTIPGQTTPFVAYWNDSKWTVVPTQIFPYFGGLSGIKALSANNVWVVGNYLDQNANIVKTMIAQWNGTQWNIVSSPNAGILSGSSNILEAITATSATDIWAVGSYQVSSSNNPVYTLVEHWNGTRWSIVPSPTPTSSTCGNSNCTALVSVTATSSTDAWAISYGFIEHWNGTQWSIVSTSSPPTTVTLNGVAASSPKDVWVVGGSYTGPTVDGWRPLIEHWDGTQWNSISTPPTPLQGGLLEGVTVLSPNTVWVVGASRAGSAAETLTELYS